MFVTNSKANFVYFKLSNRIKNRQQTLLPCVQRGIFCSKYSRQKHNNTDKRHRNETVWPRCIYIYTQVKNLQIVFALVKYTFSTLVCFPSLHFYCTQVCFAISLTVAEKNL